MHLTERILLWSTFLHSCQFVLNAALGRYDHVYGIAASWAFTSVLLLAFRLVEDRVTPFISPAAYLFYLIVVVFNLLGDLHWHFVGFAFSYARLVEGAPWIYEYLTPTSVLTGVADGFFYIFVAISLMALLGPFIPVSHMKAHRPSWRYASRVVLALASILFLLSPIARRNSLWGFVSHALAKTGADGPIRSKHQPMRLFIPEGDFQPEPLLEVPPGPGRPNILIVNLESVNATYFSSYGIRPGVEMENFDALRESRLVGMRYHSVLGGSSHGNDWAMLTSLYAPSFGPTPFSGDRSIQQKNLLYYGKRAGYRTGFFTTDFTAYREFYKLFKHPDCDVFYDKKSPELGPLPKDLTLEEQMAQLLFEGIDATDDQPFLFLYRTNNAHWPYDSRQADETMSPLERYKHAILENDRVLGEIISGLKQRGLFENTIILVTGDHGESFQEHENLSMHSGGVYEELVHVPFLISYPAHIHRQMRIQENTSHLDILPTLLDLAGLGIEDFDELEGYSLIRTLPPGRMLFVVNGDDGAVNGVI